MKFSFNVSFHKTSLNVFLLLFVIVFFVRCTTYQSKMGSSATSFYNNQSLDTTSIVYSVFLTGNAGNSLNDQATPTLQNFKKRLDNASKNSSVLFLGDNIYPLDGFGQNRQKAEEKISKQLDLTPSFDGKVFFIPGDYDWKNGIPGLITQEQFIANYKKKKSQLLPKDACGMEVVSLSDAVELIVVDSQWFMEDWDTQPEINKGCAIKTREQFLEVLDKHLLENQEKTVLLAMHHPLMSNGIYGGQYSVKQQLYPFENNIPLPIAGSFVNLFRKASGYDTNDLQNIRYKEMTNQVKTVLQKYNHVVVVSGHEQNLQYLNIEGIQQIISGAGAYRTPARAINPKDFSFGGYGYAVFDVFKNGASTVSFYTTINRKEVLLFKQKTREPDVSYQTKTYPKEAETEVRKSIFDRPISSNGLFYEFLWGKHYKKYYQKTISIKTASLDTLYGGLKPIGLDKVNTNSSLLLSDKKGKEFIMTPIEKDASTFFKSIAYQNQPFASQSKNDVSEEFLRDYFTTIHPYTPLVIPSLSKAIGLRATEPKLFYFPKQNRLEQYNADFGNAFYYLTEQPLTTFKNNTTFGKATAVISTEELLKRIRLDKNQVVDTENYIRARLFDMLVGDWDRDASNWQWAAYEEHGKTIYRPIASQRDQAFAKYDGAFLGLLKSIPAMGQMHSYGYSLSNVKSFNQQAYALDLALLPDTSEENWVKQANFMQEQLSNDVINAAFLKMPYELQDETTSKLKLHFRNRLKKLNETSRSYHKLLEKKAIVVGTQKNDVIVITRLSKGRTVVVVYNGMKTPKNIVFEKTFYKKNTNEIWLFGLEGNDEFSVEGNEKKNIRLRLIGGLNQDSYVIENGKNIKVHDFLSNSKTLTVDKKTSVLLSSNYETNTYNYKKPKFNSFSAVPLAGYNPDDGLRLGARFNFIQNGFLGNPYTQNHLLTANYYFATSGYDVAYAGNVKKIWDNFDLIVDASATSANFAQNFFGYGNETDYDKDEFGLDYNRVKIASLKLSPGLVWLKSNGSSIIGRVNLESFQVDDTSNRFISESGLDSRIFEVQNFAGVGLEYHFKNYDNGFIPTLGFGFQAIGRWTANVSDLTRQVPIAETAVNFVYQLDPKADWVLETSVKGKMLFSDNYEFYQAATLGGDSDLRGFRDNRFTGKSALYQGSDLRYRIGQIKNPFAPIEYGAFLGFDYGRVWLPSESSSQWHQSTGFGLWLTSSNVVAAKVSYFNSSDGGRIAFGMKFNF